MGIEGLVAAVMMVKVECVRLNLIEFVSDMIEKVSSFRFFLTRHE